MSSAETAIDLFAAATEESAWTLCAELDRLNAERQEIEKGVRAEAEEMVARLLGCSVALEEVAELSGCQVAEGRGNPATPQSDNPIGNPATGQPGNLTPGNPATQQPSNRSPRILVLAGQNWHKGVLGLTAGRIAQRYHRPVLAIGIEGDVAVGSGRSIGTINLHLQLESVAELFTHFGGHEFACGFSLPASNVDELRRRLEERFASLDDALFLRESKVDAEVTLGEIDREFVAAHEMLQPFGAGNLQPLFLVRNASVIATREFAEDCCEITIEDETGRGLAVLWPSACALAPSLVRGAIVDLLVQIEPDGYSPTGAKLIIVDARSASVSLAASEASRLVG